MRPRKVKRGSRILSEDHNSLVNALNKLGPKALGVLQGSANSVYQRKNREVLGVIHIPVAADYTDAKYFVRLSHCDNIAGDGATDPISFDDTGATLVTATNLAESLEDTHYLSNDTPVRMFWTWDRQSPKIRRYYFIMGPAGTLDNPYQLLPALGAWEANALQVDAIPTDVALDEDSYQFTIGRPVYDHTTTPPEFKYYMRTIKIPMMLGIEISAETVEDIDVIEPCDADVDGNSVTVQIARGAGAPAGGSLVNGELYEDTTNAIGYMGLSGSEFYFGQFIPGTAGVDFIHNVDVNVDITSFPNVTNTPNWQWNQAGDAFKSSRGLMATHITATGTVQGEQITSTDDISAAGIYNLVATTATEGYLVQNGYRLFHTYEPTDQAASFSNIFIGEDAGNFAITNVAAAYLGTGNIGIGENSLNALTTGYYNTTIGRRTGESITIGDRNVIIGYSSGLDLTDGIRNTLVGANVGDDLVNGDSNTAIGYHSLYENVDGEGNVAVGTNALSGTHAQSGDDTISIGYYSGYTSYGDNCVFIGAYAGYNHTNQNDILIINNSDGSLGSAANEVTGSLIYGYFADHALGPLLLINGALTVSGDITGDLTGNADTATALETSRNIGGVGFNGTASIVPTTIVVADTADTSCFVGLWTDASGNLLPKTDGALLYNAGTGVLTAGGFTSTGKGSFGDLEVVFSQSIMFWEQRQYIGGFVQGIEMSVTGGDIVTFKDALYLRASATDSSLIFMDATLSKAINITYESDNDILTFTGGNNYNFNNPIEVKDKIKLTAIGGFAVRLTNKTGVASVAGQLVIASTSTDDAFETVGASRDNIIGFVLDGGVADGSEEWVVTGGIADVLIDAGGCTHGDRMISSAILGSADVWNVGGAVATHFYEIGHCIETRVGAGLARCMVHLL